MTIHLDEIIEALALLSESKNLKASGKECLKGGLLTGISSVLGGLLLGPVGLAIGGTLGGVAAAVAAPKFQPVGKILRGMPDALKKKLADRFASAFLDFGIDDVIILSMMLASNSSFQELAIRQLTNFLSNEFSMRIQS